MMNRKIRRCVIALTGLLAALFLAGCSHKPTSLEIMSGMSGAIAQNSAIAMDWQLDCGMDLEAKSEEILQQTEVSLTMKGSTQGSFSKQRACTGGEFELAWPGLKLQESFEHYAQKSEQTVTDYLWLRDSWLKMQQTGQTADLAQLNILNTLQEFKDILVLSPEMVTIENKECYEMKAILLPEDLMTVIQEYMDILNPFLETEDATGNLNRVNGYDLDKKSVSLSLYVDEESNLPVTLSISLEERGSSSGKEEVTEEVDAPASWDKKVDLSQCTCNCSINSLQLKAGFAGLEEEIPDIPEEAKDAEEYSAFLEKRKTVGEDGDEDSAWSDTLYRPDGSWQLLDTYEEGSYPLMEGDNFRVDLIRVYENKESGPCADLLLTNSGRADLDIYTRGVAVNRTMLPEAAMYQHVPAGGQIPYTLQLSSAGRYGIQHLTDMYLEFEVVDTVNVYVEDVNSQVVIYRKGSISPEMLHPEEVLETDAETLADPTDQESVGENPDEETTEDSENPDTETTEDSENPDEETTEDSENPDTETTEDSENTAVAEDESKNITDKAESWDKDSILATCKQAMGEKDRILLEDEHLLVITREPLVTENSYRIPLCLVNVSGKNITLDGKDFRKADGLTMNMALNGVIFDGCRLENSLQLDLKVQEEDSRISWNLGDRTVASSPEEGTAEAEVAVTESLEEAVESEESQDSPESSSEEEGKTEGNQEDSVPYMTFSLVAYVLENYPTAEVWFRCDDLMLNYDLTLMKG